jgi:hypothetical protein
MTGPPFDRIFFKQRGERPDGSLDFHFEYSTALFEKDTIERWAGHFKELLGQIKSNFEMSCFTECEETTKPGRFTSKSSLFCKTSMAFEYSTALFEKDTIERWAGHFKELLGQITSDDERKPSA